MGTAQGQSVQPGSDASLHTKNLRHNVAASLGQIQGAPVDPNSLAPASEQKPDNPLEQIINPETEADLDDFIAGMQGRPRTEPSKNFLKAFFSRMKKKHPQGIIREERK